MDPALRVADVTVRSLREGKDNGGKKTKEETKTLKGYEEDGRTEEEAFSHRPKGGTFRPPVACWMLQLDTPPCPMPGQGEIDAEI